MTLLPPRFTYAAAIFLKLVKLYEGYEYLWLLHQIKLVKFCLLVLKLGTNIGKTVSPY